MLDLTRCSIPHTVYHGEESERPFMAKRRSAGEVPRTDKPLVWLGGEVKTPPFTKQGRQEAGMLLRLIQHGERLGMPQSEALPDVGPRCGALRVRDAGHNWRIMYRLDSHAVLVLEVYPKKSRKIPDEVMARCRERLKRFDAAVKAVRMKLDSAR